MVRRESHRGGGALWGPAIGVRQRVLGKGGRRKPLAQLSGGNLARNCLVMGGREAKQWQDFSKTWGRLWSGRGEIGAAGARGPGSLKGEAGKETEATAHWPLGQRGGGGRGESQRRGEQ